MSPSRKRSRWCAAERGRERSPPPAHEREVVDAPTRVSSSKTREADREEEAQQDGGSRDERAQLLEQLVVLALEPRLSACAFGFEHLALELVGIRRVTPARRRRSRAGMPRHGRARSPRGAHPRRERRSAGEAQLVRRCVRIISGPSVAIVNGTSCSANVRTTSRTASSSGSAFVRRFEVGQISSVIPRSRMDAMRLASCAARMPCPMRSGLRCSTTSPISRAPCRPPRRRGWLRRARVAGGLHDRPICA